MVTRVEEWIHTLFRNAHSRRQDTRLRRARREQVQREEQIQQQIDLLCEMYKFPEWDWRDTLATLEETARKDRATLLSRAQDIIETYRTFEQTAVARRLEADHPVIYYRTTEVAEIRMLAIALRLPAKEPDPPKETPEEYADRNARRRAEQAEKHRKLIFAEMEAIKKFREEVKKRDPKITEKDLEAEVTKYKKVLQAQEPPPTKGDDYETF